MVLKAYPIDARDRFPPPNSQRASGKSPHRAKRAQTIMRPSKIPTALILVGLAMPVAAQSTLDWPVGELQPYREDSGLRQDANGVSAKVYEHVVHVKGATWLRLYFADVQLGPGSFIRVTSLLDNEVQELDAEALTIWSNSSAYFNGDAVMVELVAGPRTSRNRIVIDQVASELAPAIPARGCSYPCGICDTDDRMASTVDWACRLLPAGCTASVWNEDSCLVSAGHCIGSNNVIEFRVPDSSASCGIRHPPVADQFPILTTAFDNGGVGNDWAVMTSGTNSLGQTPFERYGALRRIASSPPSTGQSLDIWGYGIDPPQCTDSQTQQSSGGSVTSVFTLSFGHNVDATCGNSGSAVIRNSEILGIASHCPCNNSATRVDHSDFSAARGELCSDGGCAPECNDGNPCTDDVCVGGSCTFTPTPGPCDDGNPCTIGDSCSGSVCMPGSPLVCDDGSICTDDICVDGSCTFTPTPGPCDDLDACTVGDACSGGVCVPGPPRVCEDGNPCTADLCVDGSCTFTPIASPCDDGNRCTIGDTCSGRICVPGSPLVCDDGNPCSADVCVDGSCTFTPIAGPCDDGNPCTIGDICSDRVCVPGSRLVCDDGLFCNGAERCITGVCQPGVAPCIDDCCEEANTCMPCGCLCIYDLDGNCAVAGGDLGLFAGCWLCCNTDQCWQENACAGTDFDCNGCVGGGDLGWFAGRWMKTCDEVDPTDDYPPCRSCDGQVVCP